MKDQKQLFARADHSNLGRAWEKELEAVHEFYRISAKADIVKNPNDWTFISERDYQKLSARYHPGMFARTDSGSMLMRARSDVDFSGGGKGFAICFDAKVTEKPHFPLANLSDHQLARLRQSARCGTIAGFMIKLAAHDRVFFLPARQADERFTHWQTHRGRRAKPGMASIKVEDLASIAVEITKNKINGLWDWLPAIQQLFGPLDGSVEVRK